MKTTFIEKTPNADSRTIEKLDKDLVLIDTLFHLKAVNEVLSKVGIKFIEMANNHDFTKIDYFDDFFENIEYAQKGNNFYNHKWWSIHQNQERHHVQTKIHDDVNMFDLIEMIVDCVCSGKARTGKVYDLKISDETLRLAFGNTIKYIFERVETK